MPETGTGVAPVVDVVFTLDDVRRMMLAIAGVDDGIELDGDIGDVPFSDLGYDSLALLELSSQVAREYGTSIPDEAVHEMPTPNAAVTYFSGRLAKGRG